MSEESTTPDLVVMTRELFAANSEEHLDAVLAHSARDIVWDTRPMDAIVGAIFEGTDEIGRLLKDWWSMWEDHDHYVEEVVDMGHGVIFAVVREDGRVKGSEGRVERTVAWVLQWVNGLLVRSTVYRDIAQARAAAERLAESRG